MTTTHPVRPLVATFAFVLAALCVSVSTAFAAPPAGSLVKSASSAAVYYFGTDGKRYVFPNESVYKTWYADFGGVQVISAADLAAMPIGGNATYRPGLRMVKIQTDPKVYAVERGGVLRWIQSEAVARALYGDDWNAQIDDVPDAFFVNYRIGDPIASATSFDLVANQAVNTIDENRSGFTLVASTASSSGGGRLSKRSCTQDVWTCTAWNACTASGTQTRTCMLSFDCPKVTTPSPATSQSCTPPAPSCTADTWTCGDWSACSTGGSQTRSCAMTADCPTATTPSPATSQSCTPPSTGGGGGGTTPPPSCTADTWSCTDWAACTASGTQARSCTMTVDCPTATTPSPATSQSCTPPTTGGSTQETVDLITDNGFESSTAGFVPFYDRDGSVTQTSTNPLIGAKSLQVTVNSYGRVGFNHDYPWDGGPLADALTVKAKVRVDSSTPAGKKLQICALAYYQNDGNVHSQCQLYAVGATPVDVNLVLNTGGAKLYRAFFQFALNDDGTVVATVDDAHLLVTKPVSTAPSCTADTWSCGAWSACTSSGIQTRSCTMTNDCAGVSTPSPATSQSCTSSGGSSGLYTVAAYHPPASRPYISFQDYSASSPGYASFKSFVDAAVAGHPDYGYTPADAVVMYALTGQTSYIDSAIHDVDAMVAQGEADIAAGNAPELAGDSYLHVGDYIEQIAFAYDRGYDRLTPSQRTRWAAFADRAIANIWDASHASWGGRSMPWSGWSTDDPGNNYHFSFLKATQLWALASQETTWIDFLQRQKFPPLVDYYAQLPGGGSREGSGYGTAQKNLFEDERMWKASTGEDLSRYSSHDKDTIDYWIHATVPTMDKFVPIGDQSRVSEPVLYDYQENLVREAVMLSKGTDQARRGLWWIDHNSITSLSGFNRRPTLMITSDTPMVPTALEYYASGVGAFFARSSWNTDASWLAFVAGPYDQSHAHQEQGAFTFYKRAWLAVTSNIWSHSGIQQGVDSNDVVRFSKNGSTIPQNESTSSMTYAKSGGVVSVQADLTPAYSNRSADVQSWTRDLSYQGDTLHVHDLCRVGSGVSAVFQVQVPVQPSVQTDGSIKAGGLTIKAPAGYTSRFVDMHAADSDYNSGWRVELSNPAACEFSVDLIAS